jgi:hypothetical protein
MDFSIFFRLKLGAEKSQISPVADSRHHSKENKKFFYKLCSKGKINIFIKYKYNFMEVKFLQVFQYSLMRVTRAFFR